MMAKLVYNELDCAFVGDISKYFSCMNQTAPPCTILVADSGLILWTSRYLDESYFTNLESSAILGAARSLANSPSST